MEKSNSIVRTFDALSAGDLSCLLVGNMPYFLMPGSNPAPQFCAAQVIVQKSKSAPKSAPSGTQTGETKKSTVYDTNRASPNCNHQLGKYIIIITKDKTKSPVNNASKYIKFFLTIEISFVCDFERPSCNVANASVVLIPCHSCGSNPVFTAGNRHFSAILPQFSG